MATTIRSEAGAEQLDDLLGGEPKQDDSLEITEVSEVLKVPLTDADYKDYAITEISAAEDQLDAKGAAESGAPPSGSTAGYRLEDEK